MATKPICSVEGCGKPSNIRGYCNKHYLRVVRHGDPHFCLRPKNSICTVDGCGRPAVTRGLCDGHYGRWKKYRDPKPDLPLREIAKRPPEGEAQRFVLEVAPKFTGDECLIYPYGKSSRGYGAVDINGKKRSVHVVVCELVWGPRPGPRFEVAHNCGVRACCNPKHLRWATRSENHADKLRHGTAQRGEQHPRVKLTEKQVREIRSLAGQLPRERIAERYGVTAGTISNIINKYTWSWLE